MSPDQLNYLYQLQQQIDRHFSLDDIKGLTFHLNIDYDHLAGDTKPTKTNSLLLYLAKDGELERLLASLKEQRPNAVWSDLLLPPKEQQQKDARFISLSLPSRQQITVHLQALTEMSEFANWAKASGEEHYIPGQSKMLPLLASPYDNLGSQQMALIKTMQQQERLLVLGEPGMGKTVALQRMVWETAQEGKRVPVFVRLQQFRGDLKESVRVVMNATGHLQLLDGLSVNLFLREIPCLFLLDGLNEIAGRWREEVIGAVGDLLTEFPQQRYVITSRVQDELWKRLRGGELVTHAVVVQRISDAQARAYLQAYMGENGQILYERLNDRLRGLVHTPLYLWMMKEAGLPEGKLPRNQGELIGSFVNKILKREEKTPSMLPVSVKKEALTHLAFTVQKWHQLDFTYRQAQDIIEEAQLNKEVETILQEVRRHGLLEGEEEHLRFMHQSIQEYFVAVYLQGVLDQERKTAAWQRKIKQWLGRSEFTEWLTNDWWAESFLQLAGLTQHNSWLARELATIKPWLAFWCVTEGQPVDKDTQAFVEAKTVTQLRSPIIREQLSALRELGRFENPRIISYLLEAINEAINNEEAINEATNNEVEKVIHLGLELLIRLGTVAEEPLLAFFASRPFNARSRVADGLAQVGDPRPGVSVVRKDGLLIPDIAWGKEVPAGRYEIGGDTEAHKSFERREVALARPFQLACYPITYVQFQCFIDAPDVTDSRWWAGMPVYEPLPLPLWSRDSFKYANRPREHVSWDQAVAFCRWLSDKLGYEVDLPHEYEWEIAARYPDGRFYPWGNEFDSYMANVRVEYYYILTGNPMYSRIDHTTAVGLYPEGVQSQLDLYDMSGNVWEWCRNKYHDPENTAIDDSSHPRVMRGGSWSNFINRARAASRDFHHPGSGDRHLGFRLVRRLPSQFSSLL